MFPSTAQDFNGSFSSSILSHISHFFASLAYPSPSLADCHRAVELARPLLNAIATLSFSCEQNNDARKDDKRGGGRSKRPSQKESKKAKMTDWSPLVDPKPFNAIGVPVPESSEEASSLTQSVLQDQRNILKVRNTATCTQSRLTGPRSALS